MTVFPTCKQEILTEGFAVLDDIFSVGEVKAIIDTIELADTSRPAFRKSSDLFAIRRFLREVPQCIPLIFNARLREVISQVFGADYFVVKSIYFDKPESSNWFVSYHQDLTISVDKKADLENFGPWSVKQGQYAVQPSLRILESLFTIRIHLDETDVSNGALRVMAGSHLKGIVRPETVDRASEREITCNVSKGGIMIMKPLLLHASGRTTNSKKRRVIHIEFGNNCLPDPLKWSERPE